MGGISKEAEVVISIRDENVPRSEVVEMLLTLPALNMTAGELITERVQAECDQRLVDKEGRVSTSLITPSEKEQLLNDVKAPRKMPEHLDRQVVRALKGFEDNAFILLVNDVQVEALDDEVSLTPQTVVTFLRLTPLVGG